MEIKEQIKQKFDTDAAFAAAVKAAKDAQEALKVLREAGFSLTEEELKGMKKAGAVALADEELDQVAGGWWIFW